MASAEAKIQIAVKNLNALIKLNTQLDKLNKTNQTLIKGIDRLSAGINDLAKGEGFGKISKDADAAAKSVDNIAKSTNKLQQFQEFIGRKGRLNKFGLMGLGGIGAGAAGIKGINNISNALSNLAPAIKLPTIALGKFGAVGKAATILTSAKLAPALGVLAVAYMAVGDAAFKLIPKTVELGKGLFGLGNVAGGIVKSGLIQASLAFKPLRTEIELTTQALLKLDERFKAPRGLITAKNRAFGIRERGTPEEEEVRIRNRRINQKAAEDRQSRMIAAGNAPISKARKQAIRLDSQFKNLPTVKAVRQLLVIEKKRLLIHKRNLRASEKLNMMAQAQGMVGSTGFTAAQYGPQPAALTMMQRMGFGSGANPQGMFASRGGMGGRLRGAGSSAMIGGMFPLLFGQGGASAAGGGLGGLAGGMLGGGFGFGLSLLGTVVGSKIQEIDDFNKSLTRLNATLSSSGDGFKTTGKDVSELAKRLGVTKQEAINVLNSFAQFDSSGVRQSLANVFGTDSGAVDQIASARTEASLVQTIFEKRQELGLEVTEQLIDQSKIVDNATLEFALVTATLKKKKDIAVEEAKRISTMERINAAVNPFHEDPFLAFGKENKNRAAKVAAGFDESFDEDVQNAIKSIEDLRKVMDKVALASATDLAEALREVNIEITKLQNPTYQLIEAASAISEAFSTSFKGIISGTMSVQQAFANMFQRIADHFLDMAAQMAAASLKQGILNMFAKPLVSMSLGGAGLPTDVGGLTTKQAFSGKAFIKYASGGYVTRPTVGLVGEAGEDEYVIPASKMASSMQRYSAGARGDSVIAGSGSSYAGGGSGGSTTVNYSGPILNFNSEEFVPKSAVGEIIATATSRGAKAGEARALSSLQNSRSKRSNIGL